MPTIRIEPLGNHRFQVTITDNASRTEHTVTVPEDFAASFPETDPEKLVRLSFEFLLARESKESILQTFELPLIGAYFPEYEKEMRETLTT